MLSAIIETPGENWKTRLEKNMESKMNILKKYYYRATSISAYIILFQTKMLLS